MIHLQDVKYTSLLSARSITSGTSITATADCIGAKYATIVISLDTAATGSVLDDLQLLEGDTTSAYTSIAAFLGGTAFAFPVPNTNTPDFIVFGVDLKKRKRYLKLSISPTVGARIGSAFAILSRCEQSPDTAAKAGATCWVVG